ncbi:MAG: branched-chain amino acid ABC transporter permease [Fimbriimonadales bacterium]|nr:branched-chain amino acid ABC transporter permease [Fimbriimonadales bacterium]
MVSLLSLPIASVDFTTLPQQLVNGLLLGAIYALIALGYTMVYGVLKLINFAHGEVFMLGSYGALFTAWALGFGPNGNAAQGSLLTLVLMLLGAMAVSGSMGLVIERFAYRPIRNHPRIASLITAIGLSLLLQYGGQVFILEGKKQSIPEKVSPYQSNIDINIVKPNEKLLEEAKALQPKLDAATAAFKEKLKTEKSEFDLSPQGELLRDEVDKLTKEQRKLQDDSKKGSVLVQIAQGKLIMLAFTLVLMAGLTYLVMKTKMGRAMRAVSQDFNAASLMGININTVISFTFFLGSVLAGAGAMMYSTFQSAPIDTFSGMAPGVKAFVAAVLGGIGNIPGAVLGGIIMGIAENLVSWAGYSNYRDAIAFVILISVLLFRPGGILGSNKVEKV